MWEQEDLEYIGSRSARYSGAVDIQEDWVAEAMADPGLVEVSPYPRSRMGASAFIGFSDSAQRVLVVIAYPDADGDWHGMNAWPASGRDLATYLEGSADV